MEMRGRNGKWLRTGDRRAVGKVGFIVVFKFRTRIEEYGGGHVSVGCQYSSRSGRGPVNRKEGANGGELATDFFFLDVEETSNVLDHLFIGES